MNYLRIVALITLIVLVLLPASVSADTMNLTNSTMRDVTDLAYPVELFYLVFVMGIMCMAIDIMFIANRNGPPASAMVLTSTVGFALFLVCSYMAPLAAKIVVVATETEVRSVSNYMFSPWVTYLCLGLSGICFLLIWAGVLRYWQLFAENQKQLRDPDNQFRMYLEGK